MKRVLCALLLSVLAVPAMAPASDADPSRFRFAGSSILGMPTAYITNGVEYISDDSRSLLLTTVAPMGKLLELSWLKPVKANAADKNLFQLKLNILEEDTWIPNVVWGVSDIKEEAGSRLFWFGASKKVDSFGLSVHAGFFKDPVSTKKRPYYGIEKTVFALVGLAAERFEDKNTVGIKVRPWPGVSLEYGRRLSEGSEQESLYKALYQKSFF